jgi:hypothetical protein
MGPGRHFDRALDVGGTAGSGLSGLTALACKSGFSFRA